MCEEDKDLLKHETSSDRELDYSLMEKYFTKDDCELIRSTSEIQKVFGKQELNEPKAYLLNSMKFLGFEHTKVDIDGYAVGHRLKKNKSTVSFILNEDNTNVEYIEYKMYPKYFPHKNIDTQLIKAFNFCYAIWDKKFNENIGSFSSNYYIWENGGNYAIGNLDYDVRAGYVTFRLYNSGKVNSEEELITECTECRNHQISIQDI